MCPDGCYCEEIEETYLDHRRLEREIEREIIDIKENIKTNVEKQKEILVNCPDYEETQFTVDDQYLV